MILSKTEARHVIRRAKQDAQAPTEALQCLNGKGVSYRRLERKLRRAYFTESEVNTELSTASVTPP